MSTAVTKKLMKSAFGTTSKRRKKSPLALAVVVLVLAAAALGIVDLDGLTGDTSSEQAQEQPATAPEGEVPNEAYFKLSADQASVAKQQLDALPVKPQYEGEYKREYFGPPWTDKAVSVAFSGNGCRTIEDVRVRDMMNVQMKNECDVQSGTLWNPYGSKQHPQDDWVQFERGHGSKVDIDHVVALGNAWKTGAYQLTEEQRTAIANDPINLVAVSASENRSKGDRDAANWVPANQEIHCGYAASQVQVKTKYNLWVTPAEHDVLAKMLDTCPSGV